MEIPYTSRSLIPHPKETAVTREYIHVGDRSRPLCALICFGASRTKWTHQAPEEFKLGLERDYNDYER